MFLPSETARLVLSYMLDQSTTLPKTISSFLTESSHLSELVSVTDQSCGVSQLSHFSKVGNKTLHEVLAEYTTILTVLHEKAKEGGMVDSFMEPISRVLEVVLSSRGQAYNTKSPVCESTVSQSTMSTSTLLPKMQTTSVQTEACTVSTSDASVQTIVQRSNSIPNDKIVLRDRAGTHLTLTPLAPPTPSQPVRYSCVASVDNQVVWSDTRGRYNKIAPKALNHEVAKNMEAKSTPLFKVSNPVPSIKLTPKFRSGPTRNTVKPNPPPTRSLPSATRKSVKPSPTLPRKVSSSSAQAQSYVPQNNNLSRSEKKYSPSQPLYHYRDEITVQLLDFDQIREEENKLVNENTSNSVIGTSTSRAVSNKVSRVNSTKNTSKESRTTKFVPFQQQLQQEVPSLPSRVSDSPKNTIKVRDNISLFGVQALDLSNNNNNNVATVDDIKAVTADTTIAVRAENSHCVAADSINAARADNNTTTKTNSEALARTDNNIIPVSSDKMFLLSGHDFMTGNRNIIDKSDDHHVNLNSTPEEVVCCPDTGQQTAAEVVASSQLARNPGTEKPVTSTPRKHLRRPKKVTLPEKPMNIAVKVKKKISRRKSRCQKCPECLREDCGICKNCQDRPKFGGPNNRKQACARKVCSNLGKSNVKRNPVYKREEADETSSNRPRNKRKLTVINRNVEGPLSEPVLPAVVAGVSRLGGTEKQRVVSTRKRMRRCGKCERCTRADCEECNTCRNKIKFGGDGSLKQACRLKMCKNRSSVPAPVKTERRKKVRAIKPSQRSKKVIVKFVDPEEILNDLKPSVLSDDSDDSDDIDEDSQDTSYEDVSTRGRKRHCKARFLNFFFEDSKP